jgi:hypothetical protein
MYFNQVMQIECVIVLIWFQNKCYLRKTLQICLVEKFNCIGFYGKRYELCIKFYRVVKEKMK